MSNPNKFRLPFRTTVFCLILSALLLVLIILGDFDRESYTALAIVGLYFLYSVLELSALNDFAEEKLDDSFIGKEVLVIESFSRIDGGFEGRVLLNGAPWRARSKKQSLVAGDTAIVSYLRGQIIQLELTE